MTNEKVFYVGKYLMIEVVTVSQVIDEKIHGLLENNKEVIVPRKNIERFTNPMPNEHDERYFMTEKMAMNYVHNMLVHKIEKINEASDKEIIDLLYSTNVELLPGEVNYVLAKRIEKIKKKLK